MNASENMFRYERLADHLAGHSTSGGATHPADASPDVWRLAGGVALAPIEKHGGPELLRVAASIAPAFSSALGTQLMEAAQDMGISPVTVEEVSAQQVDAGALAQMAGQVFAVGQLSYLQGLDVSPHTAEVLASEQLERAGYSVYFVMSLSRFRCVGIVGVPQK